MKIEEQQQRNMFIEFSFWRAKKERRACVNAVHAQNSSNNSNTFGRIKKYEARRMKMLYHHTHDRVRMLQEKKRIQWLFGFFRAHFVEYFYFILFNRDTICGWFASSTLAQATVPAFLFYASCTILMEFSHKHTEHINHDFFFFFCRRILLFAWIFTDR